MNIKYVEQLPTSCHECEFADINTVELKDKRAYQCGMFCNASRWQRSFDRFYIENAPAQTSRHKDCPLKPITEAPLVKELKQYLIESRSGRRDGKTLIAKAVNYDKLEQQLKEYKQALELACKGFCLSKSCDKEECPVPLKPNGHCDGQDQAVAFFLEQVRKNR